MYTYVCVCVCVYNHIHTLTHTLTHTHTHTHTHTYVYIHTEIHHKTVRTPLARMYTILSYTAAISLSFCLSRRSMS